MRLTSPRHRVGHGTAVLLKVGRNAGQERLNLPEQQKARQCGQVERLKFPESDAGRCGGRITVREEEWQQGWGSSSKAKPPGTQDQEA